MTLHAYYARHAARGASWVTCYSDASYSHQKKHASYSLWLKCEQGQLDRFEDCPPEIQDINAAELFAMLSGARLAIATWEGVGGIVLCTDSMNAIKMCHPNARPHRREDFRLLQAEFVAIRQKVEIRTKHVKGHQQGDRLSPAAWVNRKVDRQARSFMRDKEYREMSERMHWAKVLKPIRDAGKGGIALLDLADALAVSRSPVEPGLVQAIALLKEQHKIKEALGKAKNGTPCTVLIDLGFEEDHSLRAEHARKDEIERKGEPKGIPDYLKE